MYPICKKENVPLSWDSQYFLRKKSLVMLHVILKVSSTVKVNIYLKANLHSLLAPFTEAVNQSVKKEYVLEFLIHFSWETSFDLG